MEEVVSGHVADVEANGGREVQNVFLLNRYHNKRDECHLSSDDLSDSDIIELDT